MYEGIETSQIIELLNHILRYKLNKFFWLYESGYKELSKRQPLMAITYRARFGMLDGEDD